MSLNWPDKVIQARWDFRRIEQLRQLAAAGLDSRQVADIMGLQQWQVREKAYRERIKIKTVIARSNGGKYRPRRTKAAGPTKERLCLMCRGTFASEGPGNRVCDPCKRLPSWNTAQDYSAPALRIVR